MDLDSIPHLQENVPFLLEKKLLENIHCRQMIEMTPH